MDEAVITGIQFRVDGIPAQMGSKKAFAVKRKDGSISASVTDDNSKKRQLWANAVSSAAAASVPDGFEPIKVPVMVMMVFEFPRPQSHYGTGRNAGKLKPSAPEDHPSSPDLDKLERCVNDALTGIILADDRYICGHVTLRQWTTSTAGATIHIFRAHPDFSMSVRLKSAMKRIAADYKEYVTQGVYDG